MLEHIIERTNDFLAGFPKAVRKKKGQFFTSAETAKFMSGMFDLSGRENSRETFRKQAMHEFRSKFPRYPVIEIPIEKF